jgi:hypothetical protein
MVTDAGDFVSPGRLIAFDAQGAQTGEYITGHIPQAMLAVDKLP